MNLSLILVVRKSIGEVTHFFFTIFTFKIGSRVTMIGGSPVVIRNTSFLSVKFKQPVL